MKLETTQQDDATRIKVREPRIDAAVAIQFKDAMRKAGEGETRRIVLDMSDVTFVDSSGLGAIVACMKLFGRERRLELAGLTADVEKVFRLTRMNSIFIIHDTVADAFESREAG